MCQPFFKEPTSLPYFEELVPAGFASVADGYLEQSLDLHALLIKNPAATFFVRVEGESMINAGIHSGDLLIIDRALTPKDNSIVLALLNGAFTVKRLRGRQLLSENPLFPPIDITDECDFEVWGIVTYVIHRPR